VLVIRRILILALLYRANKHIGTQINIRNCEKGHIEHFVSAKTLFVVKHYDIANALIMPPMNSLLYSQQQKLSWSCGVAKREGQKAKKVMATPKLWLCYESFWL